MKLTPTYPVPGPCTTWSAMRPIPVLAITWIDRATHWHRPYVFVFDARRCCADV